MNPHRSHVKGVFGELTEKPREQIENKPSMDKWRKKRTIGSVLRIHLRLTISLKVFKKIYCVENVHKLHTLLPSPTTVVRLRFNFIFGSNSHAGRTTITPLYLFKPNFKIVDVFYNVLFPYACLEYSLFLLL